MLSGLSWLRPSWVKFASIRGFPGVPGPHLGRSPGPHRDATSLQVQLRALLPETRLPTSAAFPGMPGAHLSKLSMAAEFERKHPVLG